MQEMAAEVDFLLPGDSPRPPLFSSTNLFGSFTFSASSGLICCCGCCSSSFTLFLLLVLPPPLNGTLKFGKVYSAIASVLDGSSLIREKSPIVAAFGLLGLLGLLAHCCCFDW
jgi:hypothetical protein